MVATRASGIPRSRNMRFAGALGVAAALVVALAGTALAQPPDNDVRDQATTVTALPFSDSVDTSEATPHSSDPDCFSGPDNPTVWYRFIPAADGTYGASTYGSDYDTTLWVGTNNGGLEEIECNDDRTDVTSGVIWEGQAGVTYLLMVGAFGGGPGGQLEFQVVEDPPQSSRDLSIAPKGSFAKSGAAVINGTLDCSGDGEAFLEVSVTQRVGRLYIKGWGFEEISCNDSWQVQVPGENGIFKGGSVDVEAFAYGTNCGPFGCTGGFDSRTVKLSGKK